MTFDREIDDAFNGRPSAEPVESIERLLTAVKDAQCLGETPERITVRVQKVYAAYLAQERTIATLRATVERLEARVSELETYLMHQCGVPSEAAILARRGEDR